MLLWHKFTPIDLFFGHVLTPGAGRKRQAKKPGCILERSRAARQREPLLCGTGSPRFPGVARWSCRRTGHGSSYW
jgi:hypothetical protein